MAINKKIKKLIKNPKLFVKDALRNKGIEPKKAKVNGKNQFTVVSAVYGVEKYLDDYFKSFINQTLDFKQHIFLVLVDDGSLDNSAEIIKKWQKKYPKNITYIKKENGGQASARNFGLDYVKTEWVTFIDPDDFVNDVYFENIDKILQQDKYNDIGLVQCRWRIFQEAKNSYSFNHPLDFRFKNGNRIVEYKKDKNFLPSSPATSFYRFSIMRKYNIRYDEGIKPNFEDGYFSAKYFLYMPQNKIAYAADSWYNYRKRAEGGSTLDTSWENVSRFTVVPKLGYLSLLEEAEKNGEIPYALQRLIMYDIVWYFKKILNTPQSVAFLSPEEKQEFKSLVYEIFKYIDKDVIWSFELAGFWFYHKVGFLGMLKNEKPSFYMVYVDKYDENKSLLRIRYFYYGKKPLIVYKSDSGYSIPAYSKVREHYFLDDLFCYEAIEWIEINSFDKNISISLYNEDTRVSMNGKTYKGNIPISDIKAFSLKKPAINHKVLPSHIKAIRKLATTSKIQNIYRDAYVIMDRDTQADDNAEHFYRYLKENRPDLNIFFVLSSKSHDYNRLKKEGFNLLPFDSLQHRLAMLNAKYIISSHADKYVVDYMKAAYYKDMLDYKFIFLQHGIIRDDISTWLNNKEIDVFITSMPTEYNSIAGNSKYKFTEKEVALTGLARHDKLIQRTEPTENVILIMPTWRNSLVGPLANMSAQRETTDEFYQSEYAQAWKSVLHSPSLKEMADKYGYKVVFFPHVNMSIYIDWFDAPSWVEVRTHKTDPILHKLFRRAKIMITDYSSVFFEMAILKKAILYYQFDFEYMYGGNHSSQLGYFDFEKDGFGPVSYKEEDLFENLKNILENDGIAFDKYIKRMEQSLPFRDGNNRKRTIEAIENLEKPLNQNIYTKEKYIKSLEEAKQYNHTDLIEFNLEKISSKENKISSELILIYIDNMKLDKAREVLEKYNEQLNDDEKELFYQLLEQKELEKNHFSEELQNILEETSLLELTNFQNIKLLYSQKKWSLLYELCPLVQIQTIPETKQSEFYYIWGRTLRLQDDKDRALEKLAKSLSYNDREPNAALWEYASTLYEKYKGKEVKPEYVKEVFKENDYQVENITFELIKGWFDKKHYKQVSVALELIDKNSIDEELKSEFYYIWGKSYKELKRFKEALVCFKTIEKYTSSNFNILNTWAYQKGKAEIYEELFFWKDAFKIWHTLEKNQFLDDKEVDFIYGKIILCLYNLDEFDYVNKYKKIIFNRVLNNELNKDKIDLLKINNILNENNNK